MSGRTASKLSEVGVLGVLHAMRLDTGCDVADFGCATWVRPVSGSDQGQFAHNRMNEPYLLDIAV